MALGIGHINELFEPGHPIPNLHEVAEQLRADALTNESAAKLLEALEQDFPEIKERIALPEVTRRKAA